MEKKTIVARAEVLAGKENEFIAHAKKCIEATRTEEGNFSYSLYQSPFTPSSFIFYEEYKDQSSIQQHASSEHFKVFADAMKDILAEELIIEVF